MLVRNIPLPIKDNLWDNTTVDKTIQNRNILATDNTDYRIKYLIQGANYSKEKLGLYLKQNIQTSSKLDYSSQYEILYKNIPFFFHGM